MFLNEAVFLHTYVPLLCTTWTSTIFAVVYLWTLQENPQ